MNFMHQPRKSFNILLNNACIFFDLKKKIKLNEKILYSLFGIITEISTLITEKFYTITEMFIMITEKFIMITEISNLMIENVTIFL